MKKMSTEFHTIPLDLAEYDDRIMLHSLDHVGYKNKIA